MKMVDVKYSKPSRELSNGTNGLGRKTESFDDDDEPDDACFPPLTVGKRCCDVVKPFNRAWGIVRGECVASVEPFVLPELEPEPEPDPDPEPKPEPAAAEAFELPLVTPVEARRDWSKARSVMPFVESRWDMRREARDEAEFALVLVLVLALVLVAMTGGAGA